MKSFIIALILVGSAMAVENGNHSLGSGLQAGKIQNKLKIIENTKIEIKKQSSILTNRTIYSIVEIIIIQIIQRSCRRTLFTRSTVN